MTISRAFVIATGCAATVFASSEDNLRTRHLGKKSNYHHHSNPDHHHHLIVDEDHYIVDEHITALNIISKSSSSSSSSSEDEYEYFTDLTACMKRYPGYNGPYTPTGAVRLKFADMGTEEFKFSFDLMGLEQVCTNCGVHVHLATNCKGNTGPHFWDERVMTDPWKPEKGAVYNVLNFGEGTGQYMFSDGFTVIEHHRHAVTIHAQNGDRIGCGVLKKGYREC